MPILVKGSRDMGRGVGSLRVLNLFPNFEPSCGFIYLNGNNQIKISVTSGLEPVSGSGEMG